MKAPILTSGCFWASYAPHALERSNFRRRRCTNWDERWFLITYWRPWGATVATENETTVGLIFFIPAQRLNTNPSRKLLGDGRRRRTGCCRIRSISTLELAEKSLTPIRLILTEATHPRRLGPSPFFAAAKVQCTSASCYYQPRRNNTGYVPRLYIPLRPLTNVPLVPQPTNDPPS